MSRTLKWILGILAVLVVGALVGAAVWFGSQHLSTAPVFRPPVQPQIQGTPGAPNSPRWPFGSQGYGNRRNPMGGWGGPIMGGRGFGRFGPFGMGFFFLAGLLRLIIPLAILVIVAVVFYQLGKRAAVPAAARSSESSTAGQNAPKNE